MINIGLVGYGRTGKVVADEIYKQKSATLVTIFKKTKDRFIGRDIGELHGNKANGNCIRHISELEVAGELGLTVVAAEFYETGTSDFYPMLTKIISKNPDVINLQNSQPGVMALVIKQARELGYEGIILAPNGVLPEVLIPITGVEAAEGFLNNQADYTDPMWPEETRALYQDWLNRYPDLSMYTTTQAASTAVNMYVKAIQQAGTTDTEAVKDVFDDPNFRFDWMGFEAKLGGFETYGVRRVMPFANALSVITGGTIEQLDLTWVEVP